MRNTYYIMYCDISHKIKLSHHFISYALIRNNSLD